MQRYSTVFLDADETLFDFHAAERRALSQVMEEFHLPVTESNIAYYIDTNRSLWRQFDLGEITQEALGRERFARLLAHLGGQVEKGAEMNGAYETALGQYGLLLPGAEELCRRLASRCALYLLTNGMTRSQTGRLEKSSIKGYIRRMFISQAMGCQKPQRAFFDQVFSALGIGPAEKKRVVMVGDSLRSDIQGGVNAGIDTIWFHPWGDEPPAPLRPTWEARSLEQVGDIILGEA